MPRAMTLRKHWFCITIFIIFISWMAYSYINQGIFHSLIHSDTQTVIDQISSFGAFGQIVFVAIVILEVVVAPMPPLILYIAAGILYGGFYGGILVLGGNMIGAYIDFWLGKRYLGRGIRKRISKRVMQRFNSYFNRYGALAIFILRINPLTTSDLVSYLAGFTRIRAHHFIIATALGLTPLVFIQTFGGDIISSNPVLLGLTVMFSLAYLLIFIYLLFISFSRRATKTENL